MKRCVSRLGSGDLMRLSVGRHRPCAHGFFADATGEDCVISEGLVVRVVPTLLLGVTGQEMVLEAGHVRRLLPLLGRFARTGQLITPELEDFCI